MRPERGDELLVHRVRHGLVRPQRTRAAPRRARPSARSACPHYDGEEQRRPTFTRLVAAGELADGWAADDGAALVFAGEELDEVVVSRRMPAPSGCERTAGGGADEHVLPARYLGG